MQLFKIRIVWNLIESLKTDWNENKNIGTKATRKSQFWFRFFFWFWQVFLSVSGFKFELDEQMRILLISKSALQINVKFHPERSKMRSKLVCKTVIKRSKLCLTFLNRKFEICVLWLASDDCHWELFIRLGLLLTKLKMSNQTTLLRNS